MNAARSVAVLGLGAAALGLGRLLGARRRGTAHAALAPLLALAQAQGSAQRQRLWLRALRQGLNARVANPATTPAALPPHPALLATGSLLWVAPLHDLPGVLLAPAGLLARRFRRADLALAQQLAALAHALLDARCARQLGARQERARIAADLHDDLGARLLSLVHASDAADDGVAQLARASLDELRLAVRHLQAEATPAGHLLADWRAEAAQRLDTAGIALDWHAELRHPERALPAPVAAQLTRVLREALSNLIRHSGAQRCRVRLTVRATRLTLSVEDDGCGLPPQRAPRSAGGLVHIARRVQALGGRDHWARGPWGGARLQVEVPLPAPPNGAR